MAQSLIRWRKEDSIELQRAINKFNRNIKKLEKLDNIVDYLPSKVKYADLRQDINSRQDFNRIINSLRAFSKKGAAELVTLESGQITTKWQYHRANVARSRAIRTLQVKRISIENDPRAGLMGDARIAEIEATIESLNKLETRKGYEFKKSYERIIKIGDLDNELKKAVQYRRNYLDALEQMSGYDNYRMLYKKLLNIRDPFKFFELLKKSTTLRDLFEYYKDKATAQTYGGFASNQDAFNYGLTELGIYVDE